MSAQIRLLPSVPHFVFLNETKTDKADAMSLEHYTLLCKRDRCKGGGGIAIFVREDIASRAVLLEGLDCADERCWIMFHSEGGPILACCWYRPPDPGNTSGIQRLKEEFGRLRKEAIGAIVIGDINVHCKTWLRFSDRNSIEGETLYEFCNEKGLKQIVREPTRDGILLDLILTGIPSVTYRRGVNIRDHHF